MFLLQHKVIQLQLVLVEVKVQLVVQVFREVIQFLVQSHLQVVEVVELQDTLVQVELLGLLEQVELEEAVALLLISCYLVVVA